MMLHLSPAAAEHVTARDSRSEIIRLLIFIIPPALSATAVFTMSKSTHSPECTGEVYQDLQGRGNDRQHQKHGGRVDPGERRTCRADEIRSELVELLTHSYCLLAMALNTLIPSWISEFDFVLEVPSTSDSTRAHALAMAAVVAGSNSIKTSILGFAGWEEVPPRTRDHPGYA